MTTMIAGGLLLVVIGIVIGLVILAPSYAYYKDTLHNRSNQLCNTTKQLEELQKRLDKQDAEIFKKLQIFDTMVGYLHMRDIAEKIHNDHYKYKEKAQKYDAICENLECKEN